MKSTESMGAGAGRFPGWSGKPGLFTSTRHGFDLTVKWQRDYRWSVSRPLGKVVIKSGIKPTLTQAIARAEKAADDIAAAQSG